MLSRSVINALEEDGWVRYSRNNLDRLYFNPQKNGVLMIKYSAFGNIESASWNGDLISSVEAHHILSIRCFINISNEQLIVAKCSASADEQEMVREAAEDSFQKTIA